MQKESLTPKQISIREIINKRLTQGFTLMELIIVAIIIGILATLALTQYSSYKERNLDKRALAELRLIMAAEKVYRMEAGFYYDSGSVQPTAIGNINTDLGLLLSTASNRHWDYVTTADNESSTKTCCAQATRNGGDSRTYRMLDTEDDPVSGSVCP